MRCNRNPGWNTLNEIIIRINLVESLWKLPDVQGVPLKDDFLNRILESIGPVITFIMNLLSLVLTFKYSEIGGKCNYYFNCSTIWRLYTDFHVQLTWRGSWSLKSIVFWVFWVIKYTVMSNHNPGNLKVKSLNAHTISNANSLSFESILKGCTYCVIKGVYPQSNHSHRK